MPFRRGLRRRRARYEWLGNSAEVPTSVAPNTLSTTILLPQATLEEWPRGSLARMLGSIFVSPATAPAAASGYVVYLAVYWAQLSGITIDPQVTPEGPWKCWHVIFPQIGGTAAADSNASRWAGYFPIQFDMRRPHRYGELEQLQFAVKNSTNSAAAIQYSYSFRFLIKAGL